MASDTLQRRKYQCHIAGCDSPAFWEPHIKLWYRGLDGRPLALEMKASSIVCDSHKRRFVELVLSERNKELIADQLIAQNLGKPDFSSMTVEFVPVSRPKTVIEIDQGAKPNMVRCGREDQDGRCTNPARWHLYFRVWHIGQSKNAIPTRLLMNLHLCNKCKKLVKPEEFHDRNTKAQITKELSKMGVPMPDWKRMQVDFLPMPDSRPITPDAFMGME